jgi:cbb3-type cytochrome oxidase subunit 3
MPNEKERKKRRDNAANLNDVQLKDEDAAQK